MIGTTLIFAHEVGFGVAQFFRQDKVNTPGTWLRFFYYLCVGVPRRILGSYLTYFKPGFHPWDVDDRALIAEFEPLLALDALATLPITSEGCF
jgi:predicted metal-dependent hydrolase